MLNKRELGGVGEKIALNYLVEQGYIHIMSNWHTKIGEIDLIMTSPDKNITVFIEVKLRRNNKLGSGLEAITSKKKSTLFKLIQLFQLKHKQYANTQIRVDAIAIDYDHAKSSIKKIHHIQGI